MLNNPVTLTQFTILLHYIEISLVQHIWMLYEYESSYEFELCYMLNPNMTQFKHEQ